LKVIVMSNSGEFLPIVWRLKRDGVDIGIYIHNPQYRNNYNGLLNKITFSSLKKELKKAELVIFDITHPNEKTKHDIALLKAFGLKVSSASVFGTVADKFSKDHKVIGASTLTEELELGRRKGIKLAEKMGFAIPEYHDFHSLKDGAKFLKDNKELWVFKPDNNQDIDLTYVEKFQGELMTKMLDEYSLRLGDKLDYLLQKKIEGTEVSTEVWINSQGPAHYNQTIESKRLMDVDLGPTIGSQSNTVYIVRSQKTEDRSQKLIESLTKMADYLKSNGYIGPCDVNCIIKGGVPYFLEWSPRFGYDAIYCLLTLIKGKLADFFLKDFKVQFHDGYAASQRLSIPPYPYATPKLRMDFAKDVSIMGKLEDYPETWFQDIYLDGGKLKCAGSDGILGVVSTRGDSLEEAWGRLYHYIKKIKICSYIQYRTDGYKVSKNRIKNLAVA
jgi:phosphoribosylamine---glycine ligase